MDVFVIIKEIFYDGGNIKNIVGIYKNKKTLKENFDKQKNDIKKDMCDNMGTYTIDIDEEYKFVVTDYGDGYMLFVEQHKLI